MGIAERETKIVMHIKTCTEVTLQKEKFICSKCGFEIKTNRLKHEKVCDGRGPRGQRPKRYTGQGWNKGLKRAEIFGEEKASIIRKQVIDTKVKNGTLNSWMRMSPEAKKKFAEARRQEINKRYSEGWQPTAGRCKKYKYTTKGGECIAVDGSWELLVAYYFDFKDLKWERNKRRFKYFNEIENRNAHYTPDFFLPDTETFIEVKGYNDKLSKCKQKQFLLKIEMYGKEKIESLELETGVKIESLKAAIKNKDSISYLQILESCVEFGKTLDC